jgi:phosphoglycerate dehydrogenase-like enzyme
METVNVLVAHSFSEPLMEKLAAVSPILNITQRDVKTPEEMKDIASDADVLYALQTFPSPEAAPRLRWVQLHSAGVDPILADPLYTQTEVIFTTTSGIHTIQIGEYVMAQVLAFAHRLPIMLADQAAAHWPKGRWDRYVPDELYGATLGIVGYGSIGRQIARLAQGFGMRILAIKRDARRLDNDHFSLPDTGDPQAEIPDRIYPAQALHSFLGECDYVALTIPLTGDTRHLIDAPALAAMKPNAVLINIARGSVVDETALIDALQTRRIAGAALDVFSQEPLPEDSPLWKLPNVILSPHISGFSDQYDARAMEVFTENLRRFIGGEPLLNLVDRAREY